jgi:hypothetical protein
MFCWSVAVGAVALTVLVGVLVGTSTLKTLTCLPGALT